MLFKRLITERIKRSDTFGWMDGTSPSRSVPCITFHDYMAICLYDELYGYYKSGEIRVGREGDFYTSSGIGTIMAEIVASFIRRAAEGMEAVNVVAEWGGGTGRMAAKMMEAWAGADPEWLQGLQYWMIDDNPVHLGAAKETLRGTGGLRFMSAGEAMDALKREDHVILFANELLDAFPVHRVALQSGQLVELGVTIKPDTGEDFCYCYMPVTHPEIEASLYRDGIRLAEGQETEINLAAERWISDIGNRMTSGVLILIDYGDTAEELRAVHRMKGSLLCYRRHQATDDPFQAPGEQDITAHVNFTACRSAAEAAGWSVIYYDTQKQFLVDHGILELLADHSGSDPFSGAARRNRAIRQLLLSDGMSESFKVMVLRK